MPSRPRIALVTGTLAEPALRRVAEEIARAGLAEPCVIALNIQVAALLTTPWLERKLELPPGQRFDRVILPGYCRGDLAALTAKFGTPVELGPRDLHDLPEHLGGKSRLAEVPLPPAVEIIAEINHAARLTTAEILAAAEVLARDGADVIDIGCDPQDQRDPWAGVGDAVRALRDAGLRVSIDTFHPAEAAAAARAGCELVLSVNSVNLHAAADWGVEVVAVPDTPQDLASLDRVVESLQARGVPYRLDPILEPLGLGFAASLGRYIDVRRRHPQARMMMGVGNLTEMTQVDSAGLNMLLMGVCQELEIRSVLTTQVVNWARSSVRELDIARSIIRRAVALGVPPKRIDNALVMLRDPRLRHLAPQELADLAAGLTDRNIRIFTTADALHVMNKDFHLQGDDPFVLFDQMGIDDASHAFYLGFEMAKAMTALTLGKRYTQDQALGWGFLTRDEISHHDRRTHRP